MSLLRSYMKGFVASVGCSNMALASNVLSFDYLFPTYHIDLTIKANFFFPNSNTYTLDYIFDIPASEVYQSGVPIVAGIGIAFYAMHTEPTFRIHVLATLPPLETQISDLLPLAGYWAQPV